jgi:hypothetical protein
VSQPFVIVDYASELGGISISLASAFPKATVIALASGASQLDDGEVGFSLSSTGGTLLGCRPGLVPLCPQAAECAVGLWGGPG